MTREEADLLVNWLVELMDSRNLWSAHVSEVRKRDPEEPTRYRVLLERTGDPHPVAIYRGRILTRGVA